MKTLILLAESSESTSMHPNAIIVLVVGGIALLGYLFDRWFENRSTDMEKPKKPSSSDQTEEKIKSSSSSDQIVETKESSSSTDQTQEEILNQLKPVSYTHLTLPTIYSV